MARDNTGEGKRKIKRSDSKGEEDGREREVEEEKGEFL